MTGLQNGMSSKKAEKIDRVKWFLNNCQVFYDEKPNGQVTVDGTCNLWCTTEKWFDTKCNIGGSGVNSFMKHLKENEIIS